MDRFDGLAAFVAARGHALLGRAVLLTGSRAAGEDLLQASLERLLRHWGRVHGDPEPYLRQTMTRLAVDQWRFRRRRPEVFADVEPSASDDEAEVRAVRSDLIDALRQLPARQRAVIVLRYLDDLTEAETAAVLGCSVGTVKSTCSRGLARLRELTPTREGAPR